MISVSVVLLLLAFVCFLLAALSVPARVNLVALGLALWVATLLFSHVIPVASP